MLKCIFLHFYDWKNGAALNNKVAIQSFLHFGEEKVISVQGRSDGGISVYNPPQISLP